MSLQKQCQQLKSELYQLKKKARSQPENPLPDHKILNGIVFGNNPGQNSYYNHYPKRINHDHDEENETARTVKGPVLSTPSESLAYNRFNLKQEIKEIKRLENVPEEFSKTFLNKIKESIHETQVFTPVVKKVDDHDNSLLKRQLLSMSKTLKKTYSEKDEPQIVRDLAKENFSQTVNKIYSEKKTMSNLKVKELIQRNRENIL